MKTFVWDETFVTGLKQVDEQHKGLVNLINRFGEVLVSSTSVNDTDLISIFEPGAGFHRELRAPIV